jgi:hypothetical protein
MDTKQVFISEFFHLLHLLTVMVTKQVVSKFLYQNFFVVHSEMIWDNTQCENMIPKLYSIGKSILRIWSSRRIASYLFYLTIPDDT